MGLNNQKQRKFAEAMKIVAQREHNNKIMIFAKLRQELIKKGFDVNNDDFFVKFVNERVKQCKYAHDTEHTYFVVDLGKETEDFILKFRKELKP